VEKPKVLEPVEKVNVNEATTNELMGLGFTKSAAGRITSHVKKYGPYRSVDDLKIVDGVPSKLLRKLKDILEV
jgi:competence ComEA-like helix-hairpin-helix protein